MLISLERPYFMKMGLFGKKRQKEEHVLDDILARTPENPDAFREEEKTVDSGFWEEVDGPELATGDDTDPQIGDMTAPDAETGEVAWAPMEDELYGSADGPADGIPADEGYPEDMYAGEIPADEGYPEDPYADEIPADSMEQDNIGFMDQDNSSTDPVEEEDGTTPVFTEENIVNLEEYILSQNSPDQMQIEDEANDKVQTEDEASDQVLTEDEANDQVQTEDETNEQKTGAVPVEEESDLINDDLVDPVSPDETGSEPDQPDIPQYIEMIVDEDEEYGKKEPGPKPNIFKYIVIAMVIIVIAVVAAFMGRTYLLQTQLDQGRKLLEDEKFDEATATFTQALKIFHNSADAYLGLTQAAIGRGDLTGALRILDEGIEVTGSTNLEKSRENIVDQVFATYVLNDYMINILPGETHQLEMTNRSEDMYFDVSWSSDDPSVGTVDENGLVTAVRNGKATIIATVGNDTWGYKDITASLIVGVVVTYLEEAGCDYVEDASALASPCFVYQLNKDGYRIYDGTLVIEQSDATYSLTKCEVSDPDTEGYVTYDIVYTITVPTKFGILADSYEAKHAWYYNWMSTEMMLCDDYTGLVFAVQDLYGSDDVVYDSTVSWNGVDYHITGTTENEWINNEEWAITYSPLTLTTWAEAPVIGTYRIKVKVPKEYQGLVLALDKKGTTDYTDPVYDADEDGQMDTDIEYDATKTYVDTYFFDPLEDGTVRNADDFYIVRLVDFATQKGRAASVVTQ